MKKRAPRRDPAKERFWRETLGQQADSGQSIRAFCRDRQLTESAFYFWRRELRERKTQKKDDAKAGTLFVPIVAESVAEASVSPIEMVLPSGAVLRLSSGGVTAAAELISAVEARLC
jgi:transposase-like protein